MLEKYREMYKFKALLAALESLCDKKKAHLSSTLVNEQLKLVP